ncbi:MAG TPA: hypothetical protein V6D15_07225 [Oculatellaceae cyanobacterium]|jgi:hypothetical protein
MTQPLVSSTQSGQSSQISDRVATTQPSPDSNVHSLAALWARKYYTAVTSPEQTDQLKKVDTLKEVTSKEGRDRTAKKLIQNLNLASAKAWSFTENLLSEEIRRHGINPELINPLEIAADTRYLFEKALNAYALRATPRQLSVVVGKDFGKVRQKYTAVDPRAIGFVGVQFHQTGQMLLEWLSTTEQGLWMPYLKVMDDYMYMPLRKAYEVAAQYDYDSPVLAAVQHLLPITTKTAYRVCDKVSRLHPNHQTYSGSLASISVKTSSIRDVEMFQVYLCLCVLENSMNSVQQELFPLCVMLYPRLKVTWKMVQDMLSTLGWEMHHQLNSEDMAIFLPYLTTLTEMFSIDLFQEV